MYNFCRKYFWIKVKPDYMIMKLGPDVELFVTALTLL